MGVLAPHDRGFSHVAAEGGAIGGASHIIRSGCGLARVGAKEDDLIFCQDNSAVADHVSSAFAGRPGQIHVADSSVSNCEGESHV